MRVYVGCCGFAKGMKTYFSQYDTIEIQKTFYKLQRASTIEKWRSLAPENFIFNIKVFQGITHDVKSPTWKRSGIENYKELSGKVGYLRPTNEVFEYWEKMLEYARILKARVLVIQLPASFKDSVENWNNASRFFGNISRENFLIGIELRGWNSESVRKFCRRFELIDVCDLFIREPLNIVDGVAYFRLHGRYEGSRINYKYRYTSQELEQLLTKIFKLEKRGVEEIYVMFNNVYMADNALELKALLKSRYGL